MSNPDLLPVGRPPGPAYRLGKRVFDLLVTVPVAVVLAPLAAVVGSLIRLRDRGPALYRAQRVGRDGRLFTMYKFRTMVVDAESLGGSSTSARDPRITPIGHWMRKWKVDEVPQLINVLRGDMSLVGPRPQVAWDVDRYTEEERRLLSVPPGITDWASIKFRDEGEILKDEADPDEAYDRLIRPEKMKLGLEYVDNASISQDLSILFATARAVAGRGPKGQTGDASPAFSKITEDWSTLANDQQWTLASQRYSLAASLALGGDLVEVGCGTGYGLAAVARYTKTSVGIDIDEHNLAIARARAPQCEFIQGSAEDLPLGDGCADCVAALEMYYYLPDQPRFLSEVRRVLRSEGALLITMPNPERASFQPSPYSSHYPSGKELRSQVEAAGFTVEIFGSCPLEEVPRYEELLRRLLVRLHLIPRTIEGRARLKRLTFSTMRELRTIDVSPQNATNSLIALSDGVRVSRFAILVAICRPKRS